MESEIRPTTCVFCKRTIGLKEDVWRVQSPQGTIPEDICETCAKDTIAPNQSKAYSMFISRKAM